MTEPREKKTGGTFLDPVARVLRSLFKREHDPRQSPEVEDQNRSYDDQTDDVMRRVLKHDSNCVDVGCHKGSVLKKILDLAPHGTHFAFEPLPDMYKRLLKSFRSVKGLHIYDYALSDKPGTTTFQHVVTNPGYSGFRQRRYDRPHEEITEIQVRMERLDNLVPNTTPIHFIKVDVEGAELQVFQGAMETIRKNHPFIVFEHGIGAADHYGTTPENVFDLLVGQCGLRMFLMSDWLARGGGECLSREAFCEQFHGCKNYYFLAGP